MTRFFLVLNLHLLCFQNCIDKLREEIAFHEDLVAQNDVLISEMEATTLKNNEILDWIEGQINIIESNWRNESSRAAEIKMILEKNSRQRQELDATKAAKDELLDIARTIEILERNSNAAFIL